MALRQEYSLHHSEFNEFLFALVGKEKSGLELTVLSALARLGLDPWGEAARLSELSKEAAEGALTTTITKLPEGDWKVSDSRSIAVRLVKFLPRRGSLSARPPKGTGIDNQKPTSDVRKWPVWVAFAAVVLIAIFSLHAD
jgi:hypothetical protein